MKKIDTVVRRETLYVAAWTLILSVLMEAVFLVIGKWNITVLLGNLLGIFAAVLNFFLMGLTVQSAVSKEEKEAKNLVKLSMTLRNFLLVAVMALGFLIPCFDVIAVLIPLLFPSVAVKLRPMFMKAEQGGGENADEQ